MAAAVRGNFGHISGSPCSSGSAGSAGSAEASGCVSGSPCLSDLAGSVEGGGGVSVSQPSSDPSDL